MEKPSRWSSFTTAVRRCSLPSLDELRARIEIDVAAAVQYAEEHPAF